ncbi:hypothetical protein U1Q18_045643 [Sarracenia purpurea var. burkii]
MGEGLSGGGGGSPLSDLDEGFRGSMAAQISARTGNGRGRGLWTEAGKLSSGEMETRGRQRGVVVGRQEQLRRDGEDRGLTKPKEPTSVRATEAESNRGGGGGG